jgi:AraC family transcriptional regulator
METHGQKKYATSALLKSSAERGWSSISAELRSHYGSLVMPAIVPSQTEISLVVKGNENCVITRTGAGQTQRGVPTTGTFWLSPIGIGDKEATVTGDVPQSLHLYLPETLFHRLRNDFKLPVAPAHSIRFVSGITDPVIQQIGNSILSELTNETAAGRMYVETASLTLAARLLLKHCDSGASKATESSSHALDDVRLRRVLEYIVAHIDDDIRLESLAEVAGYSPFHFARKFTVATGIPPHRYISRMRLENAMAELADGTVPLAQVAHFSSQASFTRAFHRATGMTPKEYRYRR